MEVDAQALFDMLAELYPRELQHAMAELRAKQAEQRLAELEQFQQQPGPEPGEEASQTDQ